MSFLYTQLRERRLLISSEPRLIAITIEAHEAAVYDFELSIIPSIAIQEWKYLPFKAPKRKKYKDLDRQVESFIQDELTQLQTQSAHTVAHINDWVSFTITLVKEDHQPLLENHHQTRWFKLGDEEADQPLRELFINKHIGETFFSNHRNLQQFFSNQIDTQYLFKITMVDIVHHEYFCLEQFKRYFKLKNNKDIYQKLIEVFSYRNDLSQRRSIAEESLKLFMSKHRVEIPHHAILRQQKKVLEILQENPDYHVYRMQKDFKKRIKQLAEKQIRESIILDQLAYHENLHVDHNDIKHYLNLTNRPRTKEFIYFDPLSTRLQGQEAPLVAEELQHICIREKALNYMIYHLTKA